MKFKQSISAFLPAYNEEACLEETASEIAEFLKKNFSNWELIIVNDGSQDKTGEIAVQLAKKYRPRINVVTHKKNRGYGAAMSSGIEASRKDLIFYTDADAQFDIKEIKKLLPLTDRAEIVAGYRLNRQDPKTRIFVAWTYNLIMRILFGLKVKDVDCSFKIYHRRIFDKIKVKSLTGFSDTEILIKAKNLGYQITQVGVHHYPRRAGKTSYEFGRRGLFVLVKPQTVTKILKEMKRLWPELKPTKK